MAALALKAPVLAAQRTKAPASSRHSSLIVRASAAAAPEPEFVCPALQAAVCEKTSCVHPGRPVANACPDCPRRKATMRMAKSKCVHPQRPVSAACADCPRRK
ncbi:hypothetical protein COHA_007647 [Chlorella ohadii]|uniref:Uncharacterized protein n=1 Tax=Chlorella ohadii TaxID=2649997 RepID=A0AAD5DLW3_9CHLO|nr:hypothetical protein COHA_007647 [Chlorella ohadii]